MAKTPEEAIKELRTAIDKFEGVIATNPDHAALKVARDELEDASVGVFRDLEGHVEGAKLSKHARDLLRDADAELKTGKDGGRRRRKTRGRSRKHLRRTRSRRRR